MTYGRRQAPPPWRGSAPYVENLAAQWPADPHYDTKIINILHALAAQPY